MIVIIMAAILFESFFYSQQSRHSVNFLTAADAALFLMADPSE